MSEPAIDAEVELLPTEAGGRRRTVRSGYRPALWFGETSPTGEPALHSALLTFTGADSLTPGERAEVKIVPLAWETWPDVGTGTEFDVIDAGRRVGSGRLRSSPFASATEAQVRRALHSAFADWIAERFGDRLTRSPRRRNQQEPDLVAYFHDETGASHVLVGEVVGRTPHPNDVNQLVTLMRRVGASLGLIVCLDDPPAEAWGAIYRLGLVELPGGLWTSRIRVVTTRELARGDIELLPGRTQPDEVKLAA